MTARRRSLPRTLAQRLSPVVGLLGAGVLVAQARNDLWSPGGVLVAVGLFAVALAVTWWGRRGSVHAPAPGTLPRGAQQTSTGVVLQASGGGRAVLLWTSVAFAVVGVALVGAGVVLGDPGPGFGGVLVVALGSLLLLGRRSLGRSTVRLDDVGLSTPARVSGATTDWAPHLFRWSDVVQMTTEPERIELARVPATYPHELPVLVVTESAPGHHQVHVLRAARLVVDRSDLVDLLTARTRAARGADPAQ